MSNALELIAHELLAPQIDAFTIDAWNGGEWVQCMRLRDAERLIGLAYTLGRVGAQACPGRGIVGPGGVSL